MLTPHFTLDSSPSRRISHTTRLALITMLLALTSGCAIARISEQTHNETSTPTSLQKGPVALIFGESATETIKELEAYSRHYRSGISTRLYTDAIRQAYIETSAPEPGVATVTRMLETRLGKVHRFPSLEEASRAGYAVIVQLDMQVQLINNRSSKPASDLSLTFYSADQHYLGTVKGSSHRTLTPLWAGNKRESEIVSDIRQQGEVQAQALELLRQNLMNIPQS
ncbi:hypothetical protein K5D34_04885 [Pseudomonas cichorii]|uniref:hypothetical protein n=3 Tax=Pseudomonadota TaxID=1224 RepID=UPI001C8872E8|nr:hypothetical protein [Pseudomonas cichorii]MBX8486853.1 hypothetical protein [Pseudomonas cichorii]MBX8490881.1 hypothetical protein [Pseudomonas cichorii]MBX8509023.1 hypothetical protein [Pseudomonas cichorii]MBX8518329.1 hypothetical protein [Pseudomonas cichorii]MBX8524585.1 hypothetical protein [Pseudomonas cichorii]